jgi:hypothetical protein
MTTERVFLQKIEKLGRQSKETTGKSGQTHKESRK